MEWMREQGDEIAALRTVSAVPVGIAGERLDLINELLARLPDAPPAVVGRAMLTSANLHLERGSDETLSPRREPPRRRSSRRASPSRRPGPGSSRSFRHGPSGDVERVDRLCEELLREFEAMGSGLGTAYTSWVASLRAEDNVRAEALAAAACDEFRGIGADFGLAHALEGRALVLVRAGRADEAVPYVEESLRLFARSGNAGCTAHSLEAVAACLAAVGSVHPVAELSGAAEAFREATGQGHRPWELRGARGGARGAARRRPGGRTRHEPVGEPTPSRQPSTAPCRSSPAGTIRRRRPHLKLSRTGRRARTSGPCRCRCGAARRPRATRCGTL